MDIELKNKLEEFRIIKPDGCWVSHHVGLLSGYVQIFHNNKLYRIHRLAASLYLGLDLENNKQLVLHKCNNRRCFNPEHLYVGTNYDNTRDAKLNGFKGVGEFQRKKTHCPQGHEYTTKNTRIGNNGGRYCRACTRERSQALREKLRRKI